MLTPELQQQLDNLFTQGLSAVEVMDKIADMKLTVELESDAVKYIKNHRNGHNLPEIVITDRQLRDKVNDAIQALRQANNPPTLFIRNSQLCCIEIDEKNSPFIKPLNIDTLRGILTKRADFFSQNTKSVVSVSPPDDVVSGTRGR